MPDQEEELQKLRELGEEIAEAQASPWEPRILSRAFALPAQQRFVFTLQTWWDLDYLVSPLLQGGEPQTLEELESAAAAFGYEGAHDLTPEGAAKVAREMVLAVNDGFSTVCKMIPPGERADTSGDGFGVLLPILAFLVTQCGFAMEKALALPVAQAFALMAAARRNQGWNVEGVTYALRGIGLIPPEGRGV